VTPPLFWYKNYTVCQSIRCTGAYRLAKILFLGGLIYTKSITALFKKNIFRSIIRGPEKPAFGVFLNDYLQSNLSLVDGWPSLLFFPLFFFSLF
jgi:hypothetical protein